jgi:hypothetical protein
MTEEERRKGGGGKLSRSETVTVRLDPKLRYLAELAARLHRRTLSSYIEWSIKEALDSEALRNIEGIRDTIGTEAEFLWDVDDADRFAKLALRYPHLLTHEEQVRWKLIRENGYLWQGSYTGRRKEWTWTVNEDSLIYPRLREHWAAFCLAADTGEGKDLLPRWVKTEPITPPPARTAPPPAKTGFDDMEDDIPF